MRALGTSVAGKVGSRRQVNSPGRRSDLAVDPRGVGPLISGRHSKRRCVGCDVSDCPHSECNERHPIEGHRIRQWQRRDPHAIIDRLDFDLHEIRQRHRQNDIGVTPRASGRVRGQAPLKP